MFRPTQLGEHLNRSIQLGEHLKRPTQLGEHLKRPTQLGKHLKSWFSNEEGILVDQKLICYELSVNCAVLVQLFRINWSHLYN